MFLSLFMLSLAISLVSSSLALAQALSLQLARKVQLIHLVILLILNLTIVAIQQVFIDAEANIRIDLLVISGALAVQLISILLFKLYKSED
ncbi:hypothetical protein [Planctobacterium marinum]|uniref:Uncharacterized protein n=1 Tax=Planctobacterium marinum TaxID=1631968 RepID=A0AA48KT96_9ALTE|nr:hypothetical protein MACH26_06860 [Planctobacterium marinum]